MTLLLHNLFYLCNSSSPLRLVQIIVRLSLGQGLGLAIVSGHGSPSGDVPIYVKRILPESVLQEDAKIKTGDDLVAVNDLILYNSTEYATQALSNVEGTMIQPSDYY